MKSIIISTLLIIGSLSYGQTGKGFFGVSTNIPVGETKDVAVVGVSLNPGYLLEVSNKFDIGISAEYSFFKGENYRYKDNDGKNLKFKYKNSSYIPISTAFRYQLFNDVKIGADIGYAFALQNENKSGLYLKPKLSYQVDKKLDLTFGLTALKVKERTWKTIQIGLEYQL